MDMALRSPRITLTAVFLLFFLQSSAGLAKPFEYEVSPEELPRFMAPISLLQGKGAGDSMGVYNLSIPIELPLARMGLVPQVALEYTSSRAEDVLGIGWTLSLPYVRRSLRFGTPRYVGPSGVPDQDDTFEYRLGDDSGELVYVGTEGSLLLYRPKIEGSFAKFYYDTCTYTWTASDPSGNTWYFGEGTARDSLSVSRTYAWLVSRVVDPYLNKILYEYNPQQTGVDNVPYPVRITYDLVQG